MKELFVTFAPYIVWVFIIALPPELFQNFKNKKYASGTRSSWLLRIIGYTIFGIYSLLIFENVVAIVQFVALGLSLGVLAQSYIYKNAK
jgi:hypothetical protein